MGNGSTGRRALVAAVTVLITTPVGAQQFGTTGLGSPGGYLAPGGVNPGYYQGSGTTYGHAAPGYFGGFNARASQPGLYGNSGVAFNPDGVPLNPGTTSFGALGYGGSAYSGTGYFGYTPFFPRPGYEPPYMIFPQPRPLPRVDPAATQAPKSTTPTPKVEPRPAPGRSGPVQVWSRDGLRAQPAPASAPNP